VNSTQTIIAYVQRMSSNRDAYKTVKDDAGRNVSKQGSLSPSQTEGAENDNCPNDYP
jgi:hypothetical protein